ncbi:hypothetical protein BUALT_Bualt06G0134400 [Buddleja alternifolia]|uniref:RING-type E3 ubiquitin transferase n=1 Tax=Buddleja alternifolia TaxID=168488 RepID=A0AAV6XF18_9LAMI|nr:hypothetical protein BUALT_Bualt06G0134400 [Buddleja alternifolia]
MEEENRDKVELLDELQPPAYSVTAIAVSGSKKSKYVVKWALEKFVPEGQIYFKLLHIHPVISRIPTPMGNFIPISQVRDDVADAFRKEIGWQVTEKLLPYKQMCNQRKVQVEIVQIESDDVAYAITNTIRKHRIDKLVIGASSRSIFSRAPTLSSTISRCCPAFCTVYAVSKGKLSSLRPSELETNRSVGDDSSDTSCSTANSSNNTSGSQTEWTDQSSMGLLSQYRSASLPVQRFQALSTINQTLLHKRMPSNGTINSFPHIAEMSNSDVNETSSYISSFRSSFSDNPSRDQASISDTSTEYQANIDYELEKLRIELRHTRGMYAMAQGEAIDASRKINELQKRYLEEEINLKQISLKEEEAKELAKQEKQRYEDAKKEAEFVKECAEREAAERKEAEIRASREAREKQNLESALTGSFHQYRKFTWGEIISATSSFSDDLKIGMGAYGTVYKCSFHHTTAAVKVLHANEGSRTKQFQQEVRIPFFMSIKTSACTDRSCVVYEFMENGSLEDCLLRKNNTPPLPWFHRYRIAYEVASALVFLHNSKPNTIIHRDLKPANILLDRNYVSKIGDVGLATMVNKDSLSLSTMGKDTAPVGTLCYIDPEYQRTGVVSPKSDVYAFGMVILQLVTAKPAIALAHMVEIAVENDHLMEVVDGEAGAWPVEETKDLVVMALKCTELRRRDRPDLRDEVLPVLEKMKDIAERARDLALLVAPRPPSHFMCPILKKQNMHKVDGLNGLKPSTVSSVVAIAISGSKKSKYLLKWALENLIPEGGPEQVCFKLIHVFPEISSVPTPMGNGIPIAQVRDDVAAAYKKEMEMQTSEKILPYKMLCIRRKVQAEVVLVESDDTVNAIAEEIGKFNINKLVIGASSMGGMFSSSYWAPQGQNLSARISECCPGICTVYAVSKGKLSSVRPSNPDAIPSTRHDATDISRFSNYSSSYTIDSQPEWTVQNSPISYPSSLPSSPPMKQFQSVSTMNHSLNDRRTNSSDTRTLSYFSGEVEDDGVSSSSSSDINDQKSKRSSFTSLITDDQSWTTGQSSSLNASTELSSGSQVNINFEVEQLKMELKHVQGLYAKAQTEAIDASRKLIHLHEQRLEEKVKLKEISYKEEEAKKLAGQEKAKYEAAKQEAEYANKCAEKETAIKMAAEKKAIRYAKAKEKLENLLAGPVHHYQEFTWEEISYATSSFSNDLRVGMGSYGTVYKCNLRHTTAAVKILHNMAANRTKQFQQELEILSKIRHPNLLTLLGACPNRGCLVYEYMENGTLEERLFRKNNTPPIPWFERYRIAREVASALVFLHNSKPKPIIHRDLKPANILLDHNFVSKIGDVGLSTMLNSDTTNHMTTMYKDTSPVGTLCYIDPEYQRTGLVSPKSDVYAFGMVVLQLLTAKHAMALARTMEMAIDDDNLGRVLDSEAGNWPTEETKELAILALRCTELRHRDRPDLKTQIIPVLEKLRMVADKARDFSSNIDPTGPANHFICPILKDVMSDPCVAGDGYSYERKAIEEWFEENDTSPVTKMPLLNKSLIPNYTLLSAIMEWKSGKC